MSTFAQTSWAWLRAGKDPSIPCIIALLQVLGDATAFLTLVTGVVVYLMDVHGVATHFPHLADACWLCLGDCLMLLGVLMLLFETVVPLTIKGHALIQADISVPSEDAQMKDANTHVGSKRGSHAAAGSGPVDKADTTSHLGMASLPLQHGDLDNLFVHSGALDKPETVQEKEEQGSVPTPQQDSAASIPVLGPSPSIPPHTPPTPLSHPPSPPPTCPVHLSMPPQSVCTSQSTIHPHAPTPEEFLPITQKAPSSKQPFPSLQPDGSAQTLTAASVSKRSSSSSSSSSSISQKFIPMPSPPKRSASSSAPRAHRPQQPSPAPVGCLSWSHRLSSLPLPP
ncbi:TPA: hypothetical protein ACH3X1_003457 [Trebouxia sp. C0004]